MKPALRTRSRLIEYDALHRRVWIGGQRLHHGATGSLVAAVACLGLIAGQLKPSSSRPLLAAALAGGALMAHDWKDRSQWFELGHGSQP